jgi:REP element-mobilizing transposase RayT
MIIAVLALEISVLAVLVIFLIREYRRQALYHDSIRRDTEVINKICRDWKVRG